jgi:hypothetical protein
MDNERAESFYIGDTQDGKVFLSRTPMIDGQNEPLQELVIVGKEPISPPKMLMTRTEFKEWRYQLEDDGYSVELRFTT